jgi:hypothetical protein
VVLEGLGYATATVLHIANKLIDLGYVCLNQIETSSVQEGEKMTSKLTVMLDRTEEFRYVLNEPEVTGI